MSDLLHPSFISVDTIILTLIYLKNAIFSLIKDGTNKGCLGNKCFSSTLVSQYHKYFAHFLNEVIVRIEITHTKCNSLSFSKGNAIEFANKRENH